MKNLMTGLALLLLSLSAHSQPKMTFRLAYHLDQTAVTISSDPLGFFYLFKKNGELLKLDTTGKEQFRYSTTRDGELGFFDVYNGLQVLCWFPDYQKVIFLNRTLQPEAELTLSNLSISYVRTVKTALDGNIWVYDENNFQLKKISPGGQVLVVGNRLDLVLGNKWEPTTMVEYENAVYLSDPDAGILVLDVFGNYVKTLPIKGVDHFFIRDKRIFYLDENIIRSFDLLSLLDHASSVPDQMMQAPKVFWEGKYWFQVFPDEIKIFRFREG